jgi:hypothetical protein
MTTTTGSLSPEARASKVTKITALLAKTEANGCTADEASAARAMADRLMAQYDIREDECQPQTRRRPTLNDFFRDMGFTEYQPTAEEQAQRDADRQEKARAQYRRAGVHIDTDNIGNQIYHEDCKCADCRAFRTHPGASPRTGGYDYMADEPSRGRGTSRPTGSTGRRNTSHKNCDHEATSSARARCRKNRGY